MKPIPYRETLVTRAPGPLSVRALLLEIFRYFAGSPYSRTRQLKALRELDSRLRDDVGISYRDAHAFLGLTFKRK